MADTFIANPGVGGTTFGSDDVGGVHYPRIKSGWGADNSYNDPSVANPFPVQLVGTTNGGDLISRVLSAASTNATSIKASAGKLTGVYATNTNAAVRYLKFYNKASAPTVGSDTPVLTLAIPGNTAGAGGVLALAFGAAFSLGLALAITASPADSDTTAVALNEVIVNTFYQ